MQSGQCYILDAVCEYLAVDWTGIPWVRLEECYVIDNAILIGQRPEKRVIIVTETGKCRDGDQNNHMRYRIGKYEWVCILK